VIRLINSYLRKSNRRQERNMSSCMNWCQALRHTKCIETRWANKNRLAYLMLVSIRPLLKSILLRISKKGSIWQTWPLYTRHKRTRWHPSTPTTSTSLNTLQLLASSS